MSVLVIGPPEEAAIARALEYARAHVIPWATMEAFALAKFGPLALKDRKPGIERPASQHIMLGTYRAAISFEEQPEGIMKHLSVSSYRRGMIPAPIAMQMVCAAFQFSEAVCAAFGKESTVEAVARIWLEEFDPNHYAINVLEAEA